MKNIALVAEYCRIIGVKRIGLYYRVCDDPSVTVLGGGNIFPISFTPFYIFVDPLPITHIYFWNRTLHVSDSLSVHHQEYTLYTQQ